MSEEFTQERPNGRAFAERVFARFDAMDVRFDAVDRRFEGVDARFDAIDARFDRVDSRFNAVDERSDKMDARFDLIDIKLAGLDGRVQALEAKALDTKPIWERALAQLLEVQNGVADLKGKFDVLTIDVMQVRADPRRVEKRMDDLESRVQ